MTVAPSSPFLSLSLFSFLFFFQPLSPPSRHPPPFPIPPIPPPPIHPHFFRCPPLLSPPQVSRDYYKRNPIDETIPAKDLKGNTECKTDGLV